MFTALLIAIQLEVLQAKITEMGGNNALQLFVIVLPRDHPRELLKDKFILHHRVLTSSKALWHGEERKPTDALDLASARDSNEKIT